MIRRDDGDGWLLISQVEHARLAGEIAAAWGNGTVPAPPHPEWLISAVRDHDEGWRAWELAPRIDPSTGRPRDFTEMPMREATVIWTRSIADCCKQPFCSLWVSRHFCHLAEQARESRGDKPDEVAAIDRFLQQQRSVQACEEQALAPRFGPGEFVPLADEGFRFLQFFDRLSLWLCCAPRTQPEEFLVPRFGSIRFVPDTPRLLRAEPFPLSVDSLELRVPAKRIAAQRLADDAELRAALSHARTEELRWTIMR